jgi:DNA-binding IclR family transcriptional regulator
VAGPPGRMTAEKVDYLSVETRQAAQRIAESYGR